MIIKKKWIQRDGTTREWHREGWYLFGLIPLYICDLEHRGRVGMTAAQKAASGKALSQPAGIRTCNTCKKCEGFKHKGIGGTTGVPDHYEWLSDCADERMTLPHDGLVHMPTRCEFYKKATTPTN